MSDQELVELRRELHSLAELAHQERETAARMRAFLEACGPELLLTGLGGRRPSGGQPGSGQPHAPQTEGFGLAAVFDSGKPGPRVLLRCELDALPIPEGPRGPSGEPLPHRALARGVSHKCGHDGHMAIMAAVASRLVRSRPARGAVVLLFQPAEEIGEGAALVLADPKFASLAPDRVVALHNLPGYPRGSVIARTGCFAAASTGMAIRLHGATSHAAEPEGGRSPAMAVAQIIGQFSSVPQCYVPLQEATKVTIVSAALGEVAYGTTPGEARVNATIRAYENAALDRAVGRCQTIARGIAAAEELDLELELVEPFPATIGDDEVVDVVTRTAQDLGVPVVVPPAPFGWSEDFGHFTARYPGVLFGLGAGEDHPALHHPMYDFPDEMIGVGADLCMGITRRLLEESSG